LLVRGGDPSTSACFGGGLPCAGKPSRSRVGARVQALFLFVGRSPVTRFRRSQLPPTSCLSSRVENDRATKRSAVGGGSGRWFEGLRPGSAARETSPPRRLPLVGLVALQSIHESWRFRAVWVTRPRTTSSSPNRRAGLPSPSAGCSHIRLILSCAFPSLQSSTIPSRPGADVRAPSLGFLPSSRRQRAETTLAGVPGPLRSVLDVSHVLDGFLLCTPSRVCFTPQPRPGFALQGLPLARSRTGSSPAVALLPLPDAPAPRLPESSKHRARLQGLAPLANPLQPAVG
jgi:hypothetical protein